MKGREIDANYRNRPLEGIFFMLKQYDEDKRKWDKIRVLKNNEKYWRERKANEKHRMKLVDELGGGQNSPSNSPEGDKKSTTTRRNHAAFVIKTFKD